MVRSESRSVRSPLSILTYGIDELIRGGFRAGSKAQPDKSYIQQARDAITPGNDAHSANESGGLIDQATGAVQGAVGAVANLFSGEKGTGTGTHETR
jgi:hypothetical protein